MIRQGVVSEVQSTNTCSVQLEPISGCSNCSSAGSCGIQFLPASKTPVLLNAAVTCKSSISKGDRVKLRLEEPDSGWLRIVFLAYGWPTIGMIMGAVAGFWGATVLQFPEAQEFASLVGFFVGLAGGLFAWGRIEQSTHCEMLRQSRFDTITIVGVVDNSGEVI